jgi:TolA-binding protein
MTTNPEPWDDAEAAAMFTPVDGASPRCPAPELLCAARAETLPPRLQTAVSDHLEACAVCRTLADALEDDSITTLQPDESARILARVKSDGAPVRLRQRAIMQRWLLAAAVLFLAVAAWQILRPTPAPDAVGPGVSVPLLEVRSAPILPSDAQGPLAADRRGTDERGALLAALVPYREGDYPRAATEFGAMVAQHPQSAAAHFYLGMSELMRGNSRAAVNALETANRLESPDSGDAGEMLWHLAVAYYRRGRPDSAAQRLTTLCNGRSIRSAPACAALGALSIERTLRVTVTDTDGIPLSGVLVGEHHERPIPPPLMVYSFTDFSGRTDAAGRLELSGVPIDASQRVLVRAAKPGYFTATAALAPQQEMQHHFTLRPWVLTPVNQTIRGTTRLDAWCESQTQPCQRYAVTAPRNGRLEVSVMTSDRGAMDLWLEVPGGDIFAPLVNGPLQIAIDAVAGATYEIRVLSYRGQPRDFELTIQLK